jgi:hypothetical protein
VKQKFANFIKNSFSIIVIAGFLIPAGLMMNINSQTDEEPDIAVPDAGITISPVIFEYDLDPGESVSDEILVYNATGQDETLYFRQYPFVPNENGTAQILKRADLEREIDPSQWITLDKTQALVEDQEPTRAIPTRLNFTLTVPEDASAGGYYAAVLQSQQPQDEEFQEDVSGTVVYSESAALVIVNVNGDINKELNISSFYPTNPYSPELEPQGGFLGTPIFEYPPVQFITQLENTGNTHVRTTGQIYVRDGSGEQVDTFQFNESKGLVLRDSTRTFAPRFPADYMNLSEEEKEDIRADVWAYEEAFWTIQPQTTIETLEDGTSNTEVVRNENGDVQTTGSINFRYLDNIPFGEYEAELVVIYEDETGENETMSMTTTFWVLPWKVILIAIAIILGIIGVLVVIYRSGRGEEKSSSGKKRNKSGKK